VESAGRSARSPAGPRRLKAFGGRPSLKGKEPFRENYGFVHFSPLGADVLATVEAAAKASRVKGEAPGQPARDAACQARPAASKS
jgi:hypothetical protein